jgi:protein-S-isoprenylcysteine O-methyltransferase Ste14
MSIATSRRRAGTRLVPHAAGPPTLLHGVLAREDGRCTVHRRGKRGMRIKTLVGSGDRIALFTLPFVVVGMALNVAYPAVFRVGGPPAPLRAVSIVLLTVGVATWVWSVVLILSKVSRGELITGGPYALARHPRTRASRSWSFLRSDSS